MPGFGQSSFLFSWGSELLPSQFHLSHCTKSDIMERIPSQPYHDSVVQWENEVFSQQIATDHFQETRISAEDEMVTRTVLTVLEVVVSQRSQTELEHGRRMYDRKYVMLWEHVAYSTSSGLYGSDISAELQGEQASPNEENEKYSRQEKQQCAKTWKKEKVQRTAHYLVCLEHRILGSMW